MRIKKAVITVMKGIPGNTGPLYMPMKVNKKDEYSWHQNACTKWATIGENTKIDTGTAVSTLLNRRENKRRRLVVM